MSVPFWCSSHGKMVGDMHLAPTSLPFIGHLLWMPGTEQQTKLGEGSPGAMHTVQGSSVSDVSALFGTSRLEMENFLGSFLPFPVVTVLNQTVRSLSLPYLVESCQ